MDISKLFFTISNLITINDINLIVNTVVLPNLYIFIFLYIMFEEMGFPMIIPGEFFVFLAGYEVSIGKANILFLSLIILVATFIGSSILYSILSWRGINFIENYGRYIMMPKSKIEKVQNWFLQNGVRAIILGRWIFGLRIVTNIVSGIFRYPYKKFVFLTLFATFFWIILYFTLGIFFGKYYTSIITFLSHFNSIVIELVYLTFITSITFLSLHITKKLGERNQS